jgi:succinyl-CoA synthetase beta subunit
LVTANTQLAEVEKKLDNIKHAILQGIVTKTTKAMLEQAEGERDRLLANVHGGKTKADSVAEFLPNAIGKFKAKLENIGQLRQHEVEKARELLRELLGGRSFCTPAPMEANAT